MKTLPTLEPSRLAAMRDQWNAALAASKDAQEKYLELHRQRGEVEREIGMLNENVSQNRLDMGRREFLAKMAVLEARRDAISIQMGDLQSSCEAVRARSLSLGRLYARCAKFAGVDPRA